MYETSVIIPTYNRKELLKRAIQSVLDQTIGNWEIIVINDGSKDGTDEYLKELKKEWEHDIDCKLVSCGINNCGFVFIKAGHCGWPGLLRAEAIRQSTGKYICYLDDDNIYKPNHIEALSGYLDTHPDIDVVYGSTECYKKDGKVLIRDVEFNGPRIFTDNFLDTSDIMHRRECITGSIDWDRGESKGRTIHEDIELFRQFIDAGYRFAHIKEILTEYYFHNAQRTDQSNRHQIMANRDGAPTLCGVTGEYPNYYG